MEQTGPQERKAPCESASDGGLKQMVEPGEGCAEPAEFCHRLTAESKDEIAVGIMADGHTGIEEVHVAVVVTVGIQQGGPNGECIRLVLRPGPFA